MAEHAVRRQIPEVGAGCVNAHVRIRAGGAGITSVPTATASIRAASRSPRPGCLEGRELRGVAGKYDGDTATRLEALRSLAAAEAGGSSSGAGEAPWSLSRRAVGDRYRRSP